MQRTKNAGAIALFSARDNRGPPAHVAVMDVTTTVVEENYCSVHVNSLE